MLRACAILGLALCIVLPHAWAPHAWAQEPEPWPRQQPWPGVVQQQQPEEEGEFRISPLLRLQTLGPAVAPAYPGLSTYPLELLGLLMSPLERREVNLLPTIAVSEEFTDNIFLNNNNKRYDFITSFTPALMMLLNRPRFQVAAGFSNSAEVYARGSSPNDGLARQNFIGGVFYEPTPRLQFTATDAFIRDQSPDARSGGFSLGGQASWSNTLTPAVGWQVAQRTRLNLAANYSVVRLEGQGAGIDSDTYGFLSNLSHAFTPRFTGMIGYNFTYLDLRSGHGDNSTTHNPTIGFTYRVTSTLTVAVDGGPAFTELGGENFITPALSAGIAQVLPFGAASAYYSRNVAVAGGFGGPADTQTVSGMLVLPTWRDLIVIFNPMWTKAESLSDRQIQHIDVTVFTVSLGAAYRVNPYMTVFGGYSFLRQRLGRSSTTPDFDADENRVKVGVQFGYPFAFDLGK